MSFNREREGLGTPAYRELRTSISISTGDNIIILGVTGRTIRVYQLVCWARAAANIILKDGTTAINGAGFNMGTSSGFVFDFPNRPIKLAEGNSFVINVDAAVTGWVEYTQVGDQPPPLL